MSEDQETRGIGSASTDATRDLLADAGTTDEFPARTDPVAPDHLICPSCHHTVPTGDTQGGVRCENCGNSFRLARVRTGSAIDEIRVIGRFQLLQRVGQGSFGSVWRARDTQLDRVVALKIPHEHAVECGLDLERVAREARVAAQLRHPGIVRLYEMLALEDVPVLVSDFIEGTSLKAVLEKRRLTFRECALLVAQIAEALDHAHECGLVHRDIKPANIMMEPGPPSSRAEAPGEEYGPSRLGRPILVDFGLAVRPDADPVMTADGQIVGTPAYMSPEQADGRGHQVDRRSDIYSLGVVLYQLLCGELPFRGSRAMVVQQLLQEDPRPPRKVNDRIPRDLETICLKAMAKLPSRRYATAGELAADLRRFLHGEPCRARPVGRLERGWLWAMRNRAAAAAIALGTILIAGMVTVSLLYAVWERRHAEQLGYRLAENDLDRGVTLCERGEVAHGMLLMAQGLATAPGEDSDVGRVLRGNLAGWQQELDVLLAQRRHGGPITAAAFSPDGKLAATGGRDRLVRLWAGDGAEPLGGPIECTAEVRELAFSPDGLTLAIAGRDGRVRFWEIGRGRFSPATFAHGPSISAVAYSHDGKTLATAGPATEEGPDNPVRLWDVATGRPLPSVLAHGGAVVMIAFDPDDRTILSVTERGEIRRWDAKTGAPRGSAASDRDQRIRAGALSPDGSRLALAGGSSVRIYDAARLEPVRELPHPSVVGAASFSPDGRTLLTAGWDKVARLWDVASGRGLGSAAYHGGRVHAVAFRPDGSRFLTGGDDGVCQLRRHRAVHPRCLELAHRAVVDVVAVSPDGRVAITGTKPLGSGEGEVQLWDLPAGTPRARLTHSGMVTAAVFSADGRMLATASTDGTARLVDVASGRALGPPLRHEQWVHAVSFHPRGTLLLTGCEDGVARLWDVATGRALEHRFEHDQAIVAVAFSPDGALAATGDGDGVVKLWDIAAGRERHTLRHQGLIRSLAFSTDGTLLLTASLDHTARIWRVDSGQPIGKPLLHQDEVLCAAFSPDGATVLTGSKDNTAQLWSVAATEPLGPPLAHLGPVHAVAYSPDRRTVATAGDDATARFWDIATGRALGPPLRHGGMVAALAFSPDGRHLITGSWDRLARIWEAPALEASPSRSALWVQVLCGMELTGNEALGLLTPEEWQRRRQQLREPGSGSVAER